MLKRIEENVQKVKGKHVDVYKKFNNAIKIRHMGFLLWYYVIKEKRTYPKVDSLAHTVCSHKCDGESKLVFELMV